MASFFDCLSSCVASFALFILSLIDFTFVLFFSLIPLFLFLTSFTSSSILFVATKITGKYQINE